jgi:hypothetical protein
MAEGHDAGGYRRAQPPGAATRNQPTAGGGGCPSNARLTNGKEMQCLGFLVRPATFFAGCTKGQGAPKSATFATGVGVNRPFALTRQGLRR